MGCHFLLQGCSPPRVPTCISCMDRRFPYCCLTWESPSILPGNAPGPSGSGVSAVLSRLACFPQNHALRGIGGVPCLQCPAFCAQRSSPKGLNPPTFQAEYPGCADVPW